MSDIPIDLYTEATAALGEAIVRERIVTRMLGERDQQIQAQAQRIAELEGVAGQDGSTSTP